MKQNKDAVELKSRLGSGSKVTKYVDSTCRFGSKVGDSKGAAEPL